ncbi:unnamed protein product [Pleuronectes platessa]|uniref:Uncharacterized protein n=1 Tax=Pleuronectes platessa TaxID=8262 RepID=A0A9N7W0G5_PLEPL|nr:unnamed protein product [Pleuronectes platessa]
MPHQSRSCGTPRQHPVPSWPIGGFIEPWVDQGGQRSGVRCCISERVLITTRRGGKKRTGKQEEKRNTPESGRRNCAPPLLPPTQLDQPSYNTPTPPCTPFHPPSHSPSEEIDGLLGSPQTLAPNTPILPPR